MFCTGCGNKLSDGERFCGKCGTPVAGFEEGESEESVPDHDSNIDKLDSNEEYASSSVGAGWDVPYEAPIYTKLSGFKIKKSVIGAVTAAIVLLIIVWGVVSLHKKTLYVDDYVTVEYTGCDHYGSAYVDFDSYSFQMDVIRYGKPANKTMKDLKKQLIKAEKEGKSLKEYGKNEFISNLIKNSMNTDYEWLREIYNVNDNIQVHPVNTEMLSNGDDIELSMIYGEDMLKDFNLKLKESKNSIKVENLPDAVEVDPFEKISVEFEGISPNITARVIDDNDELSGYISTSIEGGDTDIKVGDTVKVVIDVDEEELLTYEGIHLSNLSKEYTCENMDAYVDSASQIPEDIMENMRKQAEDTFRSSVASEWSDDAELKDFKLIGNYFLKAKDGVWVDMPNQIYLIFKVTAKVEGEKKFSYYYYVRYKDVMLLKDGTCSVDLADYKNSSYSYFDSSGFEKYDHRFGGYEALDSLFNDCVTSQIEYYEYENNVQE